MKANSKDFTSVVGLLVKAGHKCMKVNLERSVGNVFKGKSDYIWFPGLQIVVHVNANTVIQLRQDGDGKWFWRRNRKNAWHDVQGLKGGAEFQKLIEPYYIRFINDMMMGEHDAIEPEGRSLQSGDSPQAT